MQGEATSAGLTHQFHAIAFEENLSLRQLTGVFAGARIGSHRLRTAQAKLTTQVVREDYSVIEQAGTQIGIFDGALEVGRLTISRAGVVALMVAQSAAMEYYERIVDQLFSRTGVTGRAT